MKNHNEQENLLALSQKFVSNSEYDKDDLVRFLKFFWTHMYEREKAKTDDNSERSIPVRKLFGDLKIKKPSCMMLECQRTIDSNIYREDSIP